MTPRSELSRQSFDRVLAFLDRDRDVAERRYLRVHDRLVRIFTRRGCTEPEELADRTMDRVGTKVDGEFRRGYAGDPALYFLNVANWIFHEWLRERSRSPATGRSADVSEWPLPVMDPEPLAGDDERTLHDCLEECLEELNAAERQLILEYYRGERGERIARRKRTAGLLGKSLNALRISVFHIRTALRECVSRRWQLKRPGEKWIERFGH